MMKIALVVLGMGFLSLSAEILAIRIVIPVFGSGIIQTSWVIGVYLLSLSLGHWLSTKVKRSDDQTLYYCFIGLALCSSFLLTQSFFSIWKAESSYSFLWMLRLFGVLLFSLGIMGVLQGLAFGILLEKHNQVRVGKLLGLNVLGNFCGSVVTSLVLNYYLSVTQFTIVMVVTALSLASAYFGKPSLKLALFFPCIVGLAINLSWSKRFLSYETGVSNYVVDSQGEFRGLAINGAKYSSVLIGKDGLHPHLEMLHKYLLTSNERLRVLVLGGGGFSFSMKNQHHSYTYVDIDPKMKEAVEAVFLKPVVGEFVVRDARAFLEESARSWDVIVQDITNGESEIPRHLLTREHFLAVRKRLESGAFFALNLLHQGSFWETEAVRIVKTLNNVFGSCQFIPIAEGQFLGQTLAICKNSSLTVTAKEITDDQY